MIQFYWNKALKSFGSRSLAWLVKYLYIFSVLIFLVGVASSIIFALEFPLVTLLVIVIVQVFFFILIICLSAYTIYTAHGLFKFLRTTSQLTSVQKTSEQKAVRMSKILIVCCCCEIVGIFFIDARNNFISYDRDLLHDAHHIATPRFWYCLYIKYSRNSRAEIKK